MSGWWRVGVFVAWSFVLLSLVTLFNTTTATNATVMWCILTITAPLFPAILSTRIPPSLSVLFQVCCHPLHTFFPSRPPPLTALKLIGRALLTHAARHCTGAWSCVRPMQQCPRWGSKWLRSAWRDRMLCWPTIPSYHPASASAVSGGRSSVCAYIGGFVCCQVSQASEWVGVWGTCMHTLGWISLYPFITYTFLSNARSPVLKRA